MSRFLCFCVLLLASPAGAEIITVDTDRRTETFRVSRDDVLQVVEGGATGGINMSSNSQLVVSGGDVFGNVTVAVGGGVIDISGGVFHRDVYFPDSTYASGTVDISGGVFLGTFSVADPFEPSGDFDVTITGGDWSNGTFGVKEGNATVDVYGRHLTKSFRVAGNHVVTDVSGVLLDGNPFYGVCYDFDPFTLFSEIADPIPGDANADGVVDLEDLNNVRNMFGQAPRVVLADTNNDGAVDLTDLNNVRNNFGSSSNPVPEPYSLALVVLSITLLSPMFRRHFRHTSQPNHRR